MRLVTPLRLVPAVIGLWVAARVAILMPDLLTSPAEADMPAPSAAGRVAAAPATRKDRRIAKAAGTAALGDVATLSAMPTLAMRLIAGRAPLTLSASATLLSPAGIVTPPAFSAIAAPLVRPGIALPGATPHSATPHSATPHSAAPTRPVPPAIELGTVAPNAVGVATLGPPGGATPRTMSPGIVPPAALPGVARVATLVAPAAMSRWSGGAYLFRRGDGGSPALATGGQLGGSQAGARVAWRLDPADRLAVVARAATPLHQTREAEVAVGVDWHPLPGRPLRVSIERRVDVGGDGRDAWSAYAAGGFWKPVGHGVVIDGYGQAGIVGARARDLFADGALRAGYRRELGGSRSLTVGGGAWGAAQPGVARVDVGPRVALGLPLAGTSATLAAEWRVRVAGDASPGSGLAITLAADF